MILQEVEAAGLEEKYDFFYLPIDFKVLLFLLRTTAMSAMLSLISLMLSMSQISMRSSMAKNGLASTLKKSARSAMPGSKEPTSY